MRVFISADFEGCTGVTTWEKEQEEVAGMISDVNAAVEGAFIAGATDVVVRDAHAASRNLPAERLHSRARLLRGWAALSLMMEGLDDSFDAAFFVGYHARSMTEAGVLAHTMTSAVRRLWLGGVECGEYGISAAHAGHVGVPVVLGCGDRAFAEQVSELIPGIETVAVKEGLASRSALSRSLEEGAAAIKRGAQRALARRAKIAPYRPEYPLELKIEWAVPAAATVCALVPGTERVDSTTIRCEVEHGVAAAQSLSVYLKLVHT